MEITGLFFSNGIPELFAHKFVERFKPFAVGGFRLEPDI